MTEPIQKDVSEEQARPQSTHQNERMEQINAIAKQAMDNRKEELAPAEEEGQGTEQEEEPQPEPEPEPGGEIEGEPEQPEEETVELTVNGEKVSVPLSKVKDAGIRTLQKDTAADNRLRDAAQKEKELQEREQRLAMYFQQAQQQQKPKPQGEPDFNKLVETIRYGEDDEAAEALKSLKAQQPNINPQDIVTLVEQQTKFQGIRQKFEAPPDQGGFGDIANIPALMAEAEQEVSRLIKDGSDAMDFETYRKAGEIVREKARDWAKLFMPEQNFADKQEKKKTVDVVKPATVRQPEKPPEKKPTTSEIIAGMKKARGQDHTII